MERHDETNTKDEETPDLDDVLPQIGEFGAYQKYMLWLVCLPACFPCGFGAFNQLFMADVPEHWCLVPELSNLSVGERRRLAIPERDGAYERCERYNLNWTDVLYLGFDDEVEIENATTEECLDGWEYDRSRVSSSVVIDSKKYGKVDNQSNRDKNWNRQHLQYDLVCGRDIYPTLGLVALNLGGPIGVYVFGTLNDNVGRKKSFFLCLSTFLVGGLLTATAQNFWWWAGSRVVVGLTIPAIYQIPFIISLELVGPNYRSFVTVLTCLFYTLGIIILAGITYLIRDWVHLAYATSVPFVLYYGYILFLPESPRWLLIRGRYEEALRILERIADVNGEEFPPALRRNLERQQLRHERNPGDNPKTPGVLSLFATPNMRLKTILITLNWFATETVYVGLSYYAPALGDNQYLSFTLSSLVEIPSYLVCWVVMDRWGRRWPLCLSMVISGISCMATVLLPEDAVTETLLLYLVSKFSIAASFLIIYPFSGELYPTELRGVGIGMSAYIGGLGLIIIPFITYLGSDNLVLPLLIMGVISIAVGLSTLRLPETLYHRLPQTIEDGEEFGKDFTVKDCCRCIPIRPETATVSFEDLELTQMTLDRSLEDLSTRASSFKKRSIRRLVRQSSVMDTQKSTDGTMKMTYWF